MSTASLLLGPPARRAILATTFVAPGEELHLRELVRRTGLAPRSVQVEVDQLVAADLLLERRSGNRRYLRPNQNHPLFHPVREIVLKTDGLATVIRDALSGDGVEFALVHGSLAAGTARAGSDVDLLVVGSIGLRETARRLRPAHDTLGREINAVVWTREEFECRRRENDAFLARVLAGPCIEVIGESGALGRASVVAAS